MPYFQRALDQKLAISPTPPKKSLSFSGRAKAAKPPCYAP